MTVDHIVIRLAWFHRYMSSAHGVRTNR